MSKDLIKETDFQSLKFSRSSFLGKGLLWRDIPVLLSWLPLDNHIFLFFFSLLSPSPILHVALSRNADKLCIYCRKTLLIKAPQPFFPTVSSIDSFPVKLLLFYVLKFLLIIIYNVLNNCLLIIIVT